MENNQGAFFFSFGDKDSPCSLELTIYSRLALDSQRFSCLPSAESKVCTRTPGYQVTFISHII